MRVQSIQCFVLSCNSELFCNRFWNAIGRNGKSVVTTVFSSKSSLLREVWRWTVVKDGVHLLLDLPR